MSTPDPARQPPGMPPPPPAGAGSIPQASPSSSSTSPTQSQFTTEAEAEAQRTARFRKLMYNSSLVICVACPVVALLPPRRLDLSTFGLGIAFCTSAGYAMEEKTGKGLLWHISSRIPGVRARELARERVARDKADATAAAEEQEEARRRQRQLKRAKEEEEDAEKMRKKGGWSLGVLGRVWASGKEEGDWVGRRAEREREAAEEGKGFGSLIVAQVRDAFGVKDEDEDEDDDDD